MKENDMKLFNKSGCLHSPNCPREVTYSNDLQKWTSIKTGKKDDLEKCCQDICVNLLSTKVT